MRWLSPKFEMFAPSRWYAGVVLLVIRLLQTSLMALVANQLVQATVMCCITLLSISLHNAAPYQRASDNHTALLAQWLVFLWVFTLLLRIVGLFEREVAATALGTLLCLATVAVLVIALVLANVDRIREKRAELSDVEETPPPSALTIERSDNDESGGGEPARVIDVLEEVGAIRGRTPLQEEDQEEKVAEPDETPAALTPWSSLLSLGNTAFCGAETTPGDDSTVALTTGQAHFDELARLAIAAGVERSEVARLARAHSTGQMALVSAEPPP